jgi:hypothetical protein
MLNTQSSEDTQGQGKNTFLQKVSKKFRYFRILKKNNYDKNEKTTFFQH